MLGCVVGDSAEHVTLRPTCMEHDELKELFQAAMRAYIDAAKSLEGLPQGVEFEQAYQVAQNAMLAFTRTRERFRAHVASHGCVG